MPDGFHIEPNPDPRPIDSTPGTPVQSAVDLSSQPDRPDDGPEFPPGTLPEGDRAPPPSQQLSAVPGAADTVKLPDGREIPVADLVRWADEQSRPPAPAAATPEQPPAWFEQWVKNQGLSQGQQAQPCQSQQQAPQAQPDESRFISPITQPELWIQGRANQYLQRGLNPPDEQGLRMELMQARTHTLYEQNQRISHQFQQQQEQQQLNTHRVQVQREIDTLTGQFPNLQTDSGKRVRDAFLAQAAATGEKDLKKVFQEANNLVYSFVMESYGRPKQQKLAAVGNGMPRGGGPRAPVKKDHGTDFSAISRMAEERGRGG